MYFEIQCFQRWALSQNSEGSFVKNSGFCILREIDEASGFSIFDLFYGLKVWKYLNLFKLELFRVYSHTQYLNTCKYWDNTREYRHNTWKICSPARAILASIVTILVSFEAILRRDCVNINFRSQFLGNGTTISFKTYKCCDNTHE